MTDMHFMYGRANGNASEARRLYAEAFPNRTLPSDKLFSKLHQRLRENGSFVIKKHDAGRPKTVTTPETEEYVLRRVEENPSISTRTIATELNINRTLVWKIFREQLLYPYHFQRVQALLAPDYDSRLGFSRFILGKIAENQNFTANILFTDEAIFTNNRIINFHNNHVWADANPYSVMETRHQHRYSLNVWLGIFGDRLIGPVFLPNRLDSATYMHFLSNILPPLLENVPLIDRVNQWFMHDGAPPHFAIVVRNFLNATYNNKWIGRGGPVPWPPRSPDLNPLDFCIWGYLKSLVYSRPTNNVDDLQQRIENECQTVAQNPGIFERIRASFKRRCEACVQMAGGHVEQFL